ncbi:MAG: RDD family protein [Thermoanaerobaculia bacterium]
MGRRRSRQDEPGLFDLPLDGPEPAGGSGEGPEEPSAPQGRDAPAEVPAPEVGTEVDPELDPQAATGRATDPPPGGWTEPAADGVAGAGHARAQEAPLSARYLAGLADLALHLGFGVALLFGARWLGADAGLADWPALLPVLAVFSFLYTVLTLAFWGQTPGMAWAGLVARAAGDRSLTFGQTLRRWLGGLLSAALLGLPTLLAAGGGRSLADRLSDSDLRAV